eukprot:12588569-Alexandrium_andersonii.AAC.1
MAPQPRPRRMQAGDRAGVSARQPCPTSARFTCVGARFLQAVCESLLSLAAGAAAAAAVEQDAREHAGWKGST